jgi:hypothetical protein
MKETCMNTKTQLDKAAAKAAIQPTAVAPQTGEVLRFTLDQQMKPVRTNKLADGTVPARQAGANYLPFWDDGVWMPVREGLSPGSLLDGEYTI